MNYPHKEAKELRDITKRSLDWNKKIKVLINSKGFVYCLNNKKSLNNRFDIEMEHVDNKFNPWKQGIFVFPTTE